MESVGDFEPKFKFTVGNSVDYFTIDADKTHGRVNAQGILVDDEGKSARLTIDGIAKLSDEMLSLVYNQPGAKTLPFGYGGEFSRQSSVRLRSVFFFSRHTWVYLLLTDQSAVEIFKFQTGHPEYKALENMTFVGSMRFTYEDGVQTGLEVRISQIVSGTGMD